MTRAVRLSLWALAAAAVAAAAAFVRIDTDLNRFISSATPDRQLAFAAGLQRDAAGRAVIVTLRAADPGAAARASRALAAALRASPHFVAAHNGEAVLPRADAEFLVAHRYVLSDRMDAETFSVERLHAALVQAESMLRDARAWIVEQLLPRDPTLETLHLAEQWGRAASLPLRDGVWFARDGSAAVLIALTRSAGDDAEGQQAAAGALRAAAARLEAQPEAQHQALPAAVTMHYSGLGMLAAEARDATRSRVERLGLASAVLVALILLLGYRRPLPVVYSLAPVALGLAAGMAATQALFGDVNLLAIAFACVLIDEGSDYAAYLLTQARAGERIGDEAQRIWPTLRLAVLTSAAAFAVLTLAQFRGLQQLGVLCGMGLMVAGCAARWLVPDLLGPDRRVSWTPPRFTARAARRESATRPAVPAWHYALPLAGLLLPLAVLALLPLWNDDVAAINPLPRERIAQDRALRAAAGLPLEQTVLMFVAADDQAVLQAQEAWLPALRTLRDQEALSAFDLAARHLPSERTQQQRAAALPAADVLRERLQRAAADTGFAPDAFAPLLADAAKPRGAPLTAATLPDGLLRQRVAALLLREDGGHWAGLVALAGSAPRDALIASARAAAAPLGVDVSWFEPRHSLVNLLAAVRERLVVLLALCALAVTGVIAAHHRSARLALRVMLPVVTALLLTAAAARLLLGPLTAFHVVALLLLLGLLTNYALFVHAPPLQPEPQRAARHTAFSLLVNSATTLAVFGALALSGIGVVEAVGRTVVLGIIVGLAWIVASRDALPGRMDPVHPSGATA